MKTLNIYKIWVDGLIGWDTYDSAIVVAENEEAARHIHPGDDPEDPIRGYNSETMCYDKPWYETDDDLWEWTKPENVKVELVGTTNLFPAGVVLCASYNAR